MKKWKALLAGLAVAGVAGLCGCKEEVITVADIQSEDGEDRQYIEMQEFELKETEEDNGRVAIRHCVVRIPQGYYRSEEIPGMYLHEKAPLDSSNIYYSCVPGADRGKVSDTLTGEEYKKSIEEAFQKRGQEVSLRISSFEELDMGGIPAYKIRSEYETEGNSIQQLTYLVLADNTYTITYSQSRDDELMADFEISEGEIRLVKE